MVRWGNGMISPLRENMQSGERTREKIDTQAVTFYVLQR